MNFLRYDELKQRGIGFTRVHLSRLIRAGQFPQPVNLGVHSIAWVESEIDTWAAERAAARAPLHAESRAA